MIDAWKARSLEAELRHGSPRKRSTAAHGRVPSDGAPARPPHLPQTDSVSSVKYTVGIGRKRVSNATRPNSCRGEVADPLPYFAEISQLEQAVEPTRTRIWNDLPRLRGGEESTRSRPRAFANKSGTDGVAEQIEEAATATSAKMIRLDSIPPRLDGMVLIN